MRALATDLMHLLLALPLHAVLACLALALAGWRRGPGSGLHRWRHALLAAALWFYVLGMPATGNALARWLESRHPVPPAGALPAGAAPTLLVLAGGWFRPGDAGYEVILTPADWQRIDAAVRLQRELRAPRVIFSGAPLPDGSDSVARRMAAAAVKQGLPADVAATEVRSTNTYENVVFSERQFELRKGPPVVLVTSALHMPRAVAVARWLGLPVLPWPCDFRSESFAKWQLWVPSNDGAAHVEAALHELLGLLAYRLDGRA